MTIAIGELPLFFNNPDRACAGHPNPNLWFPEHGGTGALRAIAICRECPLLKACADYATQRTDLHGVWGGLTRTDRHRIRLGQPITPSAVPAPVAVRRRPGPVGPQQGTQTARAKVAAMFDDGHDIDAIADRIGRSSRTVQRHLRATGRSRTNGGTRVAA